jgi:hypothetical protein
MKIRALQLTALTFTLPLAFLFQASCEEEETETTPDPEGCESHADCTEDAPFCEPEGGECVEPPPGSEIGWGDGSAGSVTLTLILADETLKEPIDLGFDPSAPERLWVINRRDDSVVIITNPGEDGWSFDRMKDPAAGHFMNEPPAFEFGAVDETYGQTFGICGDNDNGGDDFMGPALFSSDLDVFATQNDETGLGSHLDMLHSTTFCKGIAHVEGNVYFAFNGHKGSLDKYDFANDHGPGWDDHSDGHVYRYVEGYVEGVDDVSSHLDYDAESKLLYIADTGNRRILTLDTMSGVEGDTFPGLEFVATRTEIVGAELGQLAGEDVLQRPSGLELHRGLVFVTDHATSQFLAFDKDGELVRTLDTDLPEGSLGGFTFGPDGKVYFVDTLGGRVFRIDPES